MDAVAEREMYKWNIHLCPAVRCSAVAVALWNVGRKFPLETQVDVRIFRCFTIVTSHSTIPGKYTQCHRLPTSAAWMWIIKIFAIFAHKESLHLLGGKKKILISITYTCLQCGSFRRTSSEWVWFEREISSINPVNGWLIWHTLLRKRAFVAFVLET